MATAQIETQARQTGRDLLWKSVGVGVLVAVAFISIGGVITGAIDTPFLQRRTPLLGIDYPIMALNTLLLGSLAGISFYASRRRRAQRNGSLYGGGFLAAFAMSCPACNGLLLTAFGTGGVLSFIEPARPVIGGLTVALLSVMLVRRVRALRAGCEDCEIDDTNAGLASGADA